MTTSTKHVSSSKILVSGLCNQLCAVLYPIVVRNIRMSKL